MSCDKCEECRENGYSYCIHCGEPLDSCPHCEESRKAGYAYCASCGRPLRPVQAETRTSSQWNVLRSVIIGTSVLVSVLLLAEFCAMILGIGTVWSWASGAS